MSEKIYIAVITALWTLALANLEDRHANYALEITPVRPTISGPRNAYGVRARQKHEIIFEREYTTYAGSPDGHWYVWRLFRAFQLAERMAKHGTTLNVTGRRSKQFNEPATISISTGWLDVILRSDTLIHKTGPPAGIQERSSVSCYLLTDAQELGNHPQNFLQLYLGCRPADVVQFGRDLEAECREALLLRRQLEIMAPADSIQAAASLAPLGAVDRRPSRGLPLQSLQAERSEFARCILTLFGV